MEVIAWDDVVVVATGELDGICDMVVGGIDNVMESCPLSVSTDIRVQKTPPHEGKTKGGV